MTKQELQELQKHDRIRYIGKRPLEDVFATRQYQHPKGMYGPSVEVVMKASGKAIPNNIATKGAIISYINRWSTSVDNIYFWGGLCVSVAVDPAEWELVERRSWVEKETEYKRARSYIPFLIKDFKKKLGIFLAAYKSRADGKLEGLPVDKKLKAVMDLSPEEKMWFSILTSSPEEALKLLEDGFTESTNEGA